MRAVSSTLLALALLVPLPAAGAVDPALVAAVQERLDGLAEEIGIPGATLAVVLPDGVSFAVATGYSDLVGRVPMEPGDRLMSGSIGKSFVSALALPVEALALERRIENAEVRCGVGSRSGDPLPVPGVVRGIGVNQSLPEPRLPRPPVDPQVLD